MRNKKKMVAYLDDFDLRNLRELNGFLKGLGAAGKTVPGGYTFKHLVEEGLKEEKEE